MISRFPALLLCVGCATAAVNAMAVTRYVDVNSTNPVSPFTNPANAAATIQAAVDVAVSNDLILVTNGVYETGARITPGYGLSNRVVITENIVVRSVNGPAVTIIKGHGPMGDGAVRCVYMTNGVLDGFTLTNGFTRAITGYVQEQSGAGVWCETGGTVSNCVITGNSASENGGGTYGGTVRYCTITGNSAGYAGGGTAGSTVQGCVIGSNSALYGGGTVGGTVQNCVITGNSSSDNGGGASGGSLDNCTISGNSAGMSSGAWVYGGGANGSTLNNCTISGNIAGCGGGVSGGLVNNCVVSNNMADLEGGGVCAGTVNNSVIIGNSAGWDGGGMYDTVCTANHCIVVGNSAGFRGGGIYGGKARNSIVYYNTVGSNTDNYFWMSSVEFSCTTPLPSGPGNFTNEPVLLSVSHIATNSPCIAAGTNAYSTGVDIDGEAWLDPPSVGCDEPHTDSLTGELHVAISGETTNAVAGYPIRFLADIRGIPSRTIWDFGGGATVTNSVYATRSWSASGTFDVVLWAFNDTYPSGVAATQRVQIGVVVTNYVDAASLTPVAPYLSWATAANTIQEAIDAVGHGGVVIVTNGLYDTGARAVFGQSCSNRVMITKPITVRSVHGPGVTAIKGQYPADGGPVRCVYMSAGALSGFTLTNGCTSSGGPTDRSVYDRCGGGVLVYRGRYTVIADCKIIGNSAVYGGGTFGGVVNNCLLSGNRASDEGGEGGGAYGGTFNNCTITGNSAGELGGGVTHATVTNCIVYYNSVVWTSSITPDCLADSISYCCTSRDPGGIGNITNEPAFVDTNAANCRLQAGSPCINAGDNASVQGNLDLDGNPRIVFGRVDMGAYEYIVSTNDYDGDGLTNGEEQAIWHTDPTLPDTDGDRMNDYAEVMLAGTDPTNPASCFQVNIGQTETNVLVYWSNTDNRTYSLWLCPDLVTGSWQCVQAYTNRAPGIISYTNWQTTNATFFRATVVNTNL